MNNPNLCIQRSLDANVLREPVLRSVIQSIQLPPASRGLDAGCGIGLQAALLADAVGPKGRVTGLDIDPGLLAYGQERVSEAGYSDRVTFCAGDVSKFPLMAGSFDWVWSADCIGYPAGNLMPALGELVRLVRPGGRIILLAWSSQQLLPGYPFLEARLNATCSGYLPFLRDQKPDLNFLRASHAFNKMGLENVRVQTFVGDIQAPLTEAVRSGLISLFDMLWGQPQPEVSPQDWQEYQRLCLPGSPSFILDLPEYYAFFTYTLFQGKVPPSSS